MRNTLSTLICCIVERQRHRRSESFGQDSAKPLGTLLLRRGRLPSAAAACIVLAMTTFAVVTQRVSIAEAAPASWSLTPSPNLGGSANGLLGISCTSPSFCVAVNSYSDPTTDVTDALAEEWNGRVWTIMSTPNPSSTFNFLLGVSCTSSTNCVSVGYYVNGSGDNLTFTEIWNGSSWSFTSSPAPGIDSQLSGVSCTSSTNCIAVGNDYTGSSNQSLVESWNGSSWSVQSSPSPSSENLLQSVSCPKATFCMAVGYQSSGSTFLNLTESWNGSSWSVETSPDKGASNNSLSGVSCTSGTHCIAAGNYQKKSSDVDTLMESWNGRSWSIQSSPNTAVEDNYLNGVSCATSTSCMAVGDTYDGSENQTLAESWNGSTWSLTSTPDPSGSSNNNALDRVSCPNSTSCISTGGYFPTSTATANPQNMVESWNGSSWNVVPIPNADTTLNALSDVSCTSSTFCMAVGYYEGSGSDVDQTLIETWDGTSWEVVPSPDEGSGSELSGVSCTTSYFCMAVGQYNTGSAEDDLIEQWDGGVWSLDSSSNASSTFNELDTVSCTSLTFCIAVGRYDSGSEQLSLSDLFNGSYWGVAPTNDPSSTYNYLTAVSCVSSTDCMAVGQYVDSSSNLATMSQEWNGSTWILFYPTNISSGYNWLYSISCTSSTFCLAVGFALQPSGVYDTLVESWNGSSWSGGSAQNPSGTWNVLQGVDCTSSTDCTMVGYFDNPAQVPLVEDWEDSNISVTSNPNLGTSSSELSGVTCASAGSCAAVGNSGGQTLVETGSTPPPTISSFSPTSGPVGTTVVIKGTNFSSLASVTFNGTQAEIASSSNTKITVTVPTGATTGNITVTTAGGTATSPSKFTIT